MSSIQTTHPEVTEVRIILPRKQQNNQFLGYATVTLDNSLAIRDFRIIQVGNRIIVAKPSTEKEYHCPKCSTNNKYSALFCNQCRYEFPLNPENNIPLHVIDAENQINERAISKGKIYCGGRYTETIYLTNPEFWNVLKSEVINAYHKELKKGLAINGTT